jgi:chromosomal replication initiation ATPase DnaA
MGHVSIASTHYYLSFVEEIRSEASERFHQRFGQYLFTGIADIEEIQGHSNGGGE